MLNLFGKSSSSSSSSSGSPSKEQLRGWINALKKEQRVLARDQAAVHREELKLKAELKKTARSASAANRHNLTAATTLARAVISAQRQQEKLLLAQTQINSVVLQLRTTAASAALVGQVGQSVGVMKGMNALLAVEEVRGVARDMGKEMMKTGLVAELMDDAMAMTEADDAEALADAEVERVLYELTDGLLGQIGQLRPNKQHSGAVALAKEDKKQDEVEKVDI